MLTGLLMETHQPVVQVLYRASRIQYSIMATVAAIPVRVALQHFDRLWREHMEERLHLYLLIEWKVDHPSLMCLELIGESAFHILSRTLIQGPLPIFHAYAFQRIEPCWYQ